MKTFSKQYAQWNEGEGCQLVTNGFQRVLRWRSQASKYAGDEGPCSVFKARTDVILIPKQKQTEPHQCGHYEKNYKKTKLVRDTNNLANDQKPFFSFLTSEDYSYLPKKTDKLRSIGSKPGSIPRPYPRQGSPRTSNPFRKSYTERYSRACERGPLFLLWINSAFGDQ